MKRIVLILAGTFSFMLVSGQAGYIGKRNEISFDIFNAAAFNQFLFTYKYAYAKNGLVFITGGICNATKEMHLEDLYSNEIIKGKVTVDFVTKGFGFISNYGNQNMQLPVGYYTGLGLQWNKGTHKEEYSLNPVFSQGYQEIEITEYEYKQFTFRFMYGKNTVIASMLSLDFTVNIGVSRVKMYQKNKVMNIYGGYADPIGPYAEYPNSFPGFKKREFDEANEKITGIRFFLMPSVRVGYIF